MPVVLASHAGFCMGVRRAVQAAEQLAEAGVPACTYGELIHNPQVVADFRQRGLIPVERPEEAAGKRVLIRSHGVSPQVIEELNALDCRIEDLTCPFVTRLHEIVRRETDGGTPVIIVGEGKHPEVQGTAGWAKGPVYTLTTPEEARMLPELPEAVAVAQTTLAPSQWAEIVPQLRMRVKTLREFCTICAATQQRQAAAEALSRKADAMIVVGGRNSANTRKLWQTCAANCARTILVETAAEIPPGFADTARDYIGITAGASTPDGLLKEVVSTMSENEQVRTPEDTEVSFSDALEATLVSPRVGSTVEGTVIQITDDEVSVQIGGKSDGVIKRSELVDQDVKVGDTIEVEVVRKNDGEGRVQLSQRNVVNRKVWEALEQKMEAGETITATVKEAVKGGVRCMYEGIRVFVPGSQLSMRRMGRNEDLSAYVGKELELRIIELDKSRKSIVASHRQVEEAAKAAVWDSLSEGVIIHGIVRRVTDFGAFVDLGGVDGLIHVTELGWGRVGKPSDVVKVNQEVDVKILKLDREKDRIALSLKEATENPWETVETSYPVGCIVIGTVVRIKEFGAFVQLQPGMDGLVHISQLSLERVAKVEDAVKVGDEVHVKVLHVDPEKRQISLSIKAALEDEAMDAEAEIAEEAPAEAAEEAPEATEAE